MFLKNKTALVTGSSKGLGREIAIALAKEGAKVAVHYNLSFIEAEKVKKEIGRFDGTAITARADLRKENEVREMLAEIIKKFKRIDILINNVGNFIYKDLKKIEYGEWKNIIDTTLNSTFLCCKECLPYMRKNGFGRIINIGDVDAEKICAKEFITPYHIGKVGVVILTKSLALSEAKNNITVNCVSPGIMKNSVNKPSLKDLPNLRYTKFADVINSIMYLLNKKSDSITGENIIVANA